MNRSRGYTFIELVVYIALFSVVSIVVILSIGKLIQAYGRIRVERRVALAAEIAMERMVREVRMARSIGTAAGSILSLTSCSDPSIAGCASPAHTITRSFTLNASNQIDFTDSDNGTFRLTPDDVQVTQLTFTQDSGTSGVLSKAVYVSIKIEAGSGDYRVARTFQSFAILRGSY